MYILCIGNKNYSSWSLRPWLVLTQLQIPFEEILVPFEDGGSHEKFRVFSPTGLVPCLVHGEQTVWESLAIVEYLADRHPTIWPYEKTARAWARCAAAEMHAGFNALRTECPMTVGLRIRLHTASQALKADLKRLVELWQQGLDTFGGPFLAGGRFTAVDAFFAPVAFRIQTYGLSLPRDCLQYAQRILDLPGMMAWSEDALSEKWREPAHEDEIREIGVWLEDLRT